MLIKRMFILATALLVAGPISRPAGGGAGAGIRAITRPSADVSMSFVQPGRIVAVPFREGDRVQAGQVVIRQDDAADQVLVAQLKAQSEDITQIRASEASLAQKRVDLQKLEKAAASHAATALEVEHAKLDVTIAELSLELAKFEHAQAGRKYEEQKIRVEERQIKSPVDGSIEKIDVEVGESINTTAPVIQVVQIDPLWIDTPVPLGQALGLKVGGTAQVAFEAPGQSPLPDSPPVSSVVAGRIIFVAAVADAASDTLRVRIELPNPGHRPAGEHVLVRF